MMNTAGRQESSNLASSARNEAREDMAVSAVPSNTVICSLEQDFFTNSAAEMQLMSRAEGCGELNDIIISEEECKIKFIYEKQEDAVKARLKLHGFVFHGHEIDTDFGQAFDVNPPQMSYLKVPEPTKQFLISPPASPPIGWEPGTESPPVVNHALTDRLLTLKNDPYFVLHEGTGPQPSIIVQNCSTPSPHPSSPPAQITTTSTSTATTDQQSTSSSNTGHVSPPRIIPSVQIEGLDGPHPLTTIPPTRCPPRTSRPPPRT